MAKVLSPDAAIQRAFPSYQYRQMSSALGNAFNRHADLPGANLQMNLSPYFDIDLASLRDLHALASLGANTACSGSNQHQTCLISQHNGHIGDISTASICICRNLFYHLPASCHSAQAGWHRAPDSSRVDSSTTADLSSKLSCWLHPGPATDFQHASPAGVVYDGMAGYIWLV